MAGLRLVGQHLDPTQRPTHERHRRHEGEVPAVENREADHHQAHVVVQRQPTDAVDFVEGTLQADGEHHLEEVGARGAMTDLHAGRSPRRPRGVLEVGDLVVEHLHRRVRRPNGVGNGVHRDDAGPLVARHQAHELLHGVAHRGRRQHNGGLGIGEHGIEAFGVARQLGCEQRNRDVPGLKGAEETRHVVEALGRQDRHAITPRRHLLESGGDGP